MIRKSGYRNEKELTEEEINNILHEYYKCELTTREIQEKFKLTRRALPAIFKAHNINSHRKKRYTLDEKYFANVNTEEKAYWLGYLFADGFIGTEKTNNIVFSQKENDREIIDQFAKDIKYTGKLRTASPGNQAFKNSQSQVVINFSSPEMTQDLYRLKLTPNKISREEIPPIKSEFLRHFIRGYFDGDGSITIGKQYYKDHVYLKPALNIAGNKTFLEKITNVLPVKTSLRDSHTPWIKYLTCGSNTSMRILYDYLYKDASRFLKRKHDVFEKIKGYSCRKLQPENGINLNKVSESCSG